MADSRYRNQYMQQGGAQQRMGLLDLFPSLGQWVQGNRDALMAPYRQRSAEQAQGLLGGPEQIMNAGGGGMLGQGDVQTQAPSGLMADPTDWYKQMQYGLGLMGTPGYESAGLQFQQQALSHMLGGDARQQAQDNWQANQQRLAGDTRAKLDLEAGRRVGTGGEFKDVNELQGAETGLATDARATLAPLRAGVQLYNNVQGTVRDKGFTGMNITDDVVMTKTLAKLLQPTEAIMEADITALQQMEGLTPAVRGALAKLGMGVELQKHEREQLYDQITRIGGQRVADWEQQRDAFTKRAQSYGMTPSNVVLPGIAGGVDRQNYGTGAQMTPELKQQILDQSAQEQRQNNPNVLQQLGDWWAD